MVVTASGGGLFEEGVAREVVSLRKFAGIKGVSLRAVQKAVAARRITTTKSGKIDVKQALADWARNTAPRAAEIASKKKQRGKTASGSAGTLERGRQDANGVDGDGLPNESADTGGEDEGADALGPHAPPPAAKGSKALERSYHQSRAIREHFEAELARLKFQEQDGKLVRVDKVQKQAFETYRRFRDAMMTIPDRLAAILVGQTDQGKIHELLTTELRTALNEFADTTINREEAEEPAA